MHTRPFMGEVERKWIVFQLLCCIEHYQKNSVQHGDIKIDNVMLTSWMWVYLCDHCPYKPTYLPIVCLHHNCSSYSVFVDLHVV